MADGHIRIDIVGDDKDLQRKLKEIERLEKEKAKIEFKIESKDSDWAKIERELIRRINKYEETLKRKSEIEAKKITMPAMDLGTGFMPEESFYLEKDQQALNKINAELEKQDNKMDDLQAKQKSLISLREQDESVLEGINSKLAIANTEADKIQMTSMNKSMADVNTNLTKVGGGIKDVVRKVAKWGLALFGIRSAYMGIRRLMSTLSQYNEQLKTDISYIGFAIAKTFEPVILRIVDLVYKSLAYIRHILSAWFGINIFANSTVSAFQAGNSAMGGMVAGAKELRKQLAGFDEMTRLEAGLDGAGGAGGGGIGGGLDPSFDLSKMDVPIPKWIDWIAKNKDKILKWAIALASVLGGMKILKWISGLVDIGKNLGVVGSNLKEIFSNLTYIDALGIVVGIIGVVRAIQGVIAVIKDPVFPNFMTIMEGVGLAILGVGIVMGNVIAMIIGAGIAVAGLAGRFTYASTETGRLKKANKELREQTEKLTKAKWDVYDAENALSEAVDKQISAVQRERNALTQLQQAEIESGITGKKLQEQIDNNTRSVKDLSNEELRILDLYRQHIHASEDVKKTTEDVTNETTNLTQAQENAERQQKKTTAEMYRNQAQTINSRKEFDNFKNSVVKAFKSGEITADQAAEAITQAMVVMGKNSVKEIEGLPKAIQDNLSDERLKKTRRDLLGWGERTMRSLRDIFARKFQFNFSAGGGDGGGGGGGGSRNAKGAVYLPRLASGGIINYPNHGVVLGRAIGGEAGAEGVIPLTDSQMMAQLGSTIAENIKIHMTNVTSLNGRTLAKEMKVIKNEENFAYNGGFR